MEKRKGKSKGKVKGGGKGELRYRRRGTGILKEEKAQVIENGIEEKAFGGGA